MNDRGYDVILQIEPFQFGEINWFQVEIFECIET